MNEVNLQEVDIYAYVGELKKEIFELESQLADERIISSKLVLKLEEALEVAMGALEYYGDKTNWVQESDGNRYGVIHHKDISSIKCPRHEEEWGEPFADIGGKRAREAKTKVEEILK